MGVASAEFLFACPTVSGLFEHVKSVVNEYWLVDLHDLSLPGTVGSGNQCHLYTVPSGWSFLVALTTEHCCLGFLAEDWN